MRVIGTAGHVDHGKSTLVKALTGIDPDRLKEEKKRQMTIELGFAWYESQSEGEIGIVDVPGHRDFIENMLAGVGGIDAVLMVIAADEGIMPQTKEHLSIIDLLHVKTGLVVLTKVDLVDDPAWLDLVEMDVRERLSGTQLENAPMLRVSALTGEGIPELREAIDRMLRPLSPKLDLGRPRLPVDRVFSLTGFGTVVTGTLLDGSFHLDTEVEILPSHLQSRIRGLQTHKKSENTAFPGSRTAINLSGVEVAEINRGDVIAYPGMFRPTRRIDARLDILNDASVAIKHNDFVKVFVLTSECTGRVRLLQGQELQPGDSGWVQIEFEREMVLEKDDRFIIRRMSPPQTLGGGSVVDAHPAARYKLQNPGVIERFKLKTAPSIDNQVLAAIMENQFISAEDLLVRFGENPSLFHEKMECLVDQGKLVILTAAGSQTGNYVTRDYWLALTEKTLEILKGYHQQSPLRSGISVDELARRVKITPKELAICLKHWIEDRLLKQSNESISLFAFSIRYSANQSRRLDQYFALIEQQPFNPPGVREAREILTEEVYQSLLEQGLLTQLSADVVVRKSEFDQMLQFVEDECKRGELLTLGQFRDHFNTNRKVSQAFLEFLDRKGVTQREGEGRRLRKKR